MDDSWKTLFTQMLKSKLVASQKHNPEFSVRSLARSISMNPGAVSELLAGVRPISKDKALGLLKKLKVSEDDLNILRIAMGIEIQIHRPPYESSTDEFILNRYFSIILASLDLDDPPTNPSELSQLTNLKEDLIKSGITVLKKHGYIEEENHTLKVKSANMTTSCDPRKHLIQARHRFDLLASLEALDKFQVAERMYATIMFPSSTQGIAEIKAEVARFLDRIEVIGKKHGKSRVFNLSVGFYPLTNENAQTKNK